MQGSTNQSGFSLARILQVLTGRVPQYSRSALITRPANTTAYDAKDVIYPDVPAEGDQVKSIVLPNIAHRAGTNLFLTNVLLIDFATEATKLDATVYLFTAPLETAPVDNDAFAPTAADMANFVGKVDIPQANADEVGGQTVYQVPGNLVLPTTTADLHAILVAKNAYQPVTGEQFQLAIGAMPKDMALF